MRKRLPLSPTELEVLRYIARGFENREIAGKTFRSTETIRTHVKSILYKLKARNRTHAVAIAYHVGIFQGLSRTEETSTSPLTLPEPDLTVQIPPGHPASETSSLTDLSAGARSSAPDTARRSLPQVQPRR
ncbi:response regulator transcription factor [Amycolatopsis thailandensis]|uniref:response regulator transcription factor n=1 Tax=Amycolatopsis thailandensis TaxID=589330 RepID=UPI00362C8BEF